MDHECHGAWIPAGNAMMTSANREMASLLSQPPFSSFVVFDLTVALPFALQAQPQVKLLDVLVLQELRG